MARTTRSVLVTALKGCAALLVGGVVLAGCGATPPAQRPLTPNQQTSSAPVETTVSSPVSSPVWSPVPSSTSETPVSTEVVTPAPAPATPQRATKTVPTVAPKTTTACGENYYRNSAGNCVHRPEQAPVAPAGATARCADGTYSFSQHRQGTCSGHGGVAAWL